MDKKKENQKNGKNEIMNFIDRYGIYYKDIDDGRVKEKKNIPKRRKSTEILTVDLHGKTKQEARPLLHKSFETCKSKGYSKLLIIHGKGRHSDKNSCPAIKKLVHSMLKNEFYHSLVDFRTAPPKDGGEGATIVLLR